MKIVEATYGPKDVTEYMQQCFKSKNLNLFVSNAVFGDTNHGVLKKLIVKFDDDSILETNENEFLIYPKILNERLGIFYTNNNNKLTDKTISYCLKTIELSAYEKSDIITCVWNKITDNNFLEIIAQTKVSSHLNQVLQILQCLYTARIRNPNYKYVSFLEHDCLYPEGYFEYKDFSENCILNTNYIGLSKDGWQDNLKGQTPLSQMVMKFDYAIKHFESIFPNALVTNNGVVDNVKNVGVWDCINPSVHINHGHNFTSHFETYSKQKKSSNEYWGDCSEYAYLFS